MKAIRKMTRAEATAWKERWEIVNAFEREELRAASPALRMRQLGTLMQWVFEMGWQGSLGAEESAVRERWKRLRRANGS